MTRESGSADRSVAVLDDRIALGGRSSGDDGAADVYREHGAGWVHQVRLVDSIENPTFGMGQAVALHSESVVVTNNNELEDGIRSGVALVFEIHGWNLDAQRDTVSEGDTFLLKSCGGRPGNLALLAAVDVNGVPIFRVVAVTTVDGRGRQRLTGIVPPGLAGLEITFESYTKSTELQRSNRLLITFQ